MLHRRGNGSAACSGHWSCNLQLLELKLKISIPTPWKVNGNSEGVGGLKSQNFERIVWGLTLFPEGVDSNQKT